MVKDDIYWGIRIMKWSKRIVSAFLILSMCMNLGMTAQATGVEETDEEEAYKKQLEEIHNMPVQSNKLENWPKVPGTYGEAAILMEAGTGAILYAKNIEDKHFPASITKVLTALVAVENGEMTDPVKMSHESVAFLQPGDSSIALKEGDEINLEQALYATLLASANEAAYTVGENVGINAGHDYHWFIEQMNQKCKELGGVNSNFVNTNGLHDENHYTCALDMGLIGCEIFKHPEIFEIMQTQQYVIEESDTVEEHVFQQKHKMLLNGYQAYYEDAVGGKTGYTSDALSTLITMADNEEMQLVCVVLRTYGKNIYPDTTNLFEYGFDNFKKISIDGLEKSEDVGEILTGQEGGYVVLPEGVEFTDLKMKLIPDDSNNGEATLKYTYQEVPVGSARAKLSASYLKQHSIQIEEPKEAKKETKQGMPKTTKIILVILCAVLLILVVLFVRASIIRSRRRRRRRQRRAQMKQEKKSR